MFGRTIHHETTYHDEMAHPWFLLPKNNPAISPPKGNLGKCKELVRTTHLISVVSTYQKENYLNNCDEYKDNILTRNQHYYSQCLLKQPLLTRLVSSILRIVLITRYQSVALWNNHTSETFKLRDLYAGEFSSGFTSSGFCEDDKGEGEPPSTPISALRSLMLFSSSFIRPPISSSILRLRNQIIIQTYENKKWNSCRETRLN